MIKGDLYKTVSAFKLSGDFMLPLINRDSFYAKIVAERPLLFVGMNSRKIAIFYHSQFGLVRMFVKNVINGYIVKVA